MNTIRDIARLSMITVFLMATFASACRATVQPDLTTAIRANQIQQVGTLLSEGANINERDEAMEQTPLMWAVQTGHIDMVRALLAHGANVNAKDDAGQTALSLADHKGYKSIATALIKAGAKRDAKVARHTMPIGQATFAAAR